MCCHARHPITPSACSSISNITLRRRARSRSLRPPSDVPPQKFIFHVLFCFILLCWARTHTRIFCSVCFVCFVLFCNKNSTVGLYPGVAVSSTPDTRVSALFADQRCGEGTKLILYMQAGSVLSRSFTSKDTHTPRGELLVVYGDARQSYMDSEIARETAAVCMIHDCCCSVIMIHLNDTCVMTTFDTAWYLVVSVCSFFLMTIIVLFSFYSFFVRFY